MEQSAEFDLDLAIHHFLDTYNTNGILSEMDRDELLDHLYAETQDLQRTGLAPAEALLISQKRLGAEEMITAEYQKAKPWTRIIQLFAFAFIILFGIKMILNFLQIVSLSTTVLIDHFAAANLNTFLQWGDIPLQILSLGLALGVSRALIKRMSSTKIKDLWPVPVVYIISEIARFASVLIATQYVDPQTYGTLSMNITYMMFGVGVVGVLVILGLMIKHRNLRLQMA